MLGEESYRWRCSSCSRFEIPRWFGDPTKDDNAVPRCPECGDVMVFLPLVQRHVESQFHLNNQEVYRQALDTFGEELQRNEDMRVKIGDRYYDSEKEPIMVVLSDNEKRIVTEMPMLFRRLCCFPDEGFSQDYIEKWMDEGYDDPQSRMVTK